MATRNELALIVGVFSIEAIEIATSTHSTLASDLRAYRNAAVSKEDRTSPYRVTHAPQTPLTRAILRGAEPEMLDALLEKHAEDIDDLHGAADAFLTIGAVSRRREKEAATAAA